ncbi:MAG: peroxiredoxin [Betaproteobacteria bacterium TMED156]|nr:MAG: peroxiredoxin [Betaproteobacteria bacterium TMED156]|tara:strand:- start:153 stop:641 length:489 start_codon:yes stop_codon:yes gene_type:complete
MKIKENDSLPESTLFEYENQTINSFNVISETAGKKIILLGVPGAFTPTCSEKHLPEFLEHADDFFKKGVDEIWCLSVNDPFVMYAWGLVVKSTKKIRMISDGNAEFTKKIGLSEDLSKIGLGIRSNRYGMIINDGVASAVFIEDDPGKFENSKVKSILAKLN